MAALRRRLLDWYRRKRRDLPWRRRRDPYAIHVSEVMLQQTTVAAVLPYYRRFMERFPTPRALASAREEEVLRLWSGLGYYHRARRLQAAVRELGRSHRWRYPEEAREMRGLPGVGAYTAAALASIAFGRAEAVVDGNVTRVLSRLFTLRGRAGSGPLQHRCAELAALLLSRRAPGSFNQAMMELGATVCATREPACQRCPLAGDCAAYARGASRRFPEPPRRRRPVARGRAAVLIEEEERVLLARVPRGRPNAGLLELPSVDLDHGDAAEAALVDGLARTGLLVATASRLGTVRHSITHHRITLEVFLALRRGRLPPGGKLRFVHERRLDGQALSSAGRKALALSRERKGRARPSPRT